MKKLFLVLTVLLFSFTSSDVLVDNGNQDVDEAVIGCYVTVYTEHINPQTGESSWTSETHYLGQVSSIGLISAQQVCDFRADVFISLNR